MVVIHMLDEEERMSKWTWQTKIQFFHTCQYLVKTKLWYTSLLLCQRNFLKVPSANNDCKIEEWNWKEMVSLKSKGSNPFSQKVYYCIKGYCSFPNCPTIIRPYAGHNISTDWLFINKHLVINSSGLHIV